MMHSVMVVIVGFLLATSAIFIAIELRSRFDRSFLIFGLANILLVLFCLVDIVMQPDRMVVGWTKVQHVMAAFFPAVLLWLLMALVGKVHTPTLVGLAVAGVFFSFTMISDAMFIVHGNNLSGTVFYNALYVPFMTGSIAGCIAYLCFQYWKSKGRTKTDLGWHLIGFGVLGASGIVEMMHVATGNPDHPRDVPSVVVFGVLFYCLTTTIVFINRLSIIIRNRERVFSQLREAYSELDRLRPMARAGQLTSVFAHEVKNKSFGISLMLDSARRAAVTPAVAKALDRCFSASSSISRSGREILAQSERAASPATPFDIGACAGEAATRALDGCPGTVTADLHLQDIVVQGDRLKLQSVFDILLTNSIQAGASHLRLRAAVGNGCAAIAVEDNGEGCDLITLDNLFTPFFTTRQDRFGTGLGLSIAQSVIQNHGGFISAYSKNVVGDGKRGMIFCITLPLSGITPMPMEDDPEILVIEEGLSRQLPAITRIFSHINVRCRTLPTGETPSDAFPSGIKTIRSFRTDTLSAAADLFFIDPAIPTPAIREKGSAGVTILTEAWALENLFGPGPSPFKKELFCP